MRLILLFLIMVFSSCEQQTPDHKTSESSLSNSRATHYVNEYGAITIEPVAENQIHAYFENNNGIQWDTSFTLNTDNSIFESSFVKGKKVYQNEFIFLFISSAKVSVLDISGIATLPMKTQIKSLYTRPFFRSDSIITTRGIVKRGKGDIYLNGIFLDEFPSDHFKDTIEIKGKVMKEKYPRAYYSTPESPQGMFGDTTKIHYRLTMNTIKVISH